MTFNALPEDDPTKTGTSDSESPSVVALSPSELQKSIELREFLIAVGHFMDLPKRPTRATMASARVVPRRSRLWRATPVIAGALLFALLVVSAWNRRPPALPEALLGDWSTTNPRYADRQLSFTATEVLLGAQPGSPPSHHRITRLTTSERADTLVLALTYDQDGEPTELHAALVNGTPSRLVFARPAGLVWERRAAVDAR